MVKRILTNQAVQKIIALKNDNTENHTFSEIAGIIEREFGQKVSFQTIAKAYHKHKDTMVVEVAQVKPKSNITAMLQQRKAEKQAQVTTPQSTPAHTPNQPHLPPSKRVYQAPDMDKLTRMLHMSDDEFREMMRQEAEEEANQKIGKLNY